MQKSFCYIPIVSSVTLWERGTSHTNPSPRCEKRTLPCSRFVNHMKNFSASHRTEKIHFLPFPGFVEGTDSPMTGNRLLYTHQFITPNSPASTASFEEETYEEASPSLLPFSGMDEDDLFFTMQNLLRGPPKQAWISPFLEKQAANKLLKRSQSVNTVSLEAAGRHIPLQNHPLVNSKGDSGPVLRPFTAIGLCRSVSQNSPSLQISYKTSSESVQQEKVAASRSSTSSTTNTDSLSICGNALGRRLVAITPEMTPKHPHSPAERKPKAASTFRVHVAKEPLPLLVGCSTRLFSKKLMKVCSLAAPRPPRRFHTACSQTLSRPVVNAVVNAHLH